MPDSGSDSGSDSDFYGRPEVIATMKQRARQPQVDHPITTMEAMGSSISTVSNLADTEHPLRNPFAGVPYAWQLGESIEEFIDRLPPSTTQASVHTPCIYICNPRTRRKMKAESTSQGIPGCGDEGTEAEDGVHTRIFVEGARERLELLSCFLRGLTRADLPPAAALRDAEAARSAATRDILGLAGHLGVTCGKWLLHVPPRQVDDAWRQVARETYLGTLGISAKIATENPTHDNRGRTWQGARLICVYTPDFRDVTDIGRVLLRLETMGWSDAKEIHVYTTSACDDREAVPD